MAAMPEPITHGASDESPSSRWLASSEVPGGRSVVAVDASEVVVLSGPAVVEERETTTVVGPGARFQHDANGHLIIELPVAEGQS